MSGAMKPAVHRVFLTTDAVGGVWQYALDLARFFRTHEIEVILAILGPAPSADKRAEVELVPGLKILETGLPLEWMTGRPEEISLAGRALAEMAEETGAEIVHLSNPALACDAEWSVPLVATLHSCVGTWWRTMRVGEDMPEEFAWRTECIARGLSRADVATAPTAAFARLAGRTYRGVDFRVIHNGRDDTAFAALDMPRTGALTTGRLWDEAKNIRAIDLAAKEVRTPVFAAGPTEGPHGVAQLFPHLQLLGALPNVKVRQRLAGSAIYVSASLYEPFGLGVLEAAQSGCALVLSDIESFRELWGGAAYFVDPSSPASIAEALNAISADEELRLRLGRTAQERSQRYTTARMAMRTLSAYADAMKAGRHRGAA